MGDYLGGRGSPSGPQDVQGGLLGAPNRSPDLPTDSPPHPLICFHPFLGFPSLHLSFCPAFEDSPRGSTSSPRTAREAPKTTPRQPKRAPRTPKRVPGALRREDPPLYSGSGAPKRRRNPRTRPFLAPQGPYKCPQRAPKKSARRRGYAGFLYFRRARRDGFQN